MFLDLFGKYRYIPNFSEKDRDIKVLGTYRVLREFGDFRRFSEGFVTSRIGFNPKEDCRVYGVVNFNENPLRIHYFLSKPYFTFAIDLIDSLTL